MAQLQTYEPKGFLGLTGDLKPAKVVVLPYGFAESEIGRQGPEDIIRASYNLETFDDELFDDIPAQIPLWTARQPMLPDSAEQAVSDLAGYCDGLARQKKLPIVLGGDHTITSGALSGLSERFREVSLVIFDSHLDFIDPTEQKLNKNNWLGQALPRVRNAVILGARSYNKAEWDFWKHNLSRLMVYEAGTEGSWGSWSASAALDFLADYVYVSFDLDVLDPSIMPATETPEPGGLSFDQALGALRKILGVRNVIGMDVCNLAPIPGFQSANVMAAMLVKKMILYAVKGKQLTGK